MSAPYLPTNLQKWLEDAPAAAFLLDFDGTMVHLSPHPDDVLVPRELIENLKKISQNKKLSFAIVTGRSLSTLARLMDGMTTIAVGSHGAEWRSHPDAEIEILASAIPPSLRLALNNVAVAHDCIFEDKIYTISMHLPFEKINIDLTDEIRASMGDAQNAYVIRKIGRTYEVLQSSINKGFGIRHLMQHPPFLGKWPIYIGDDVDTDTTLVVVDELHGSRLGVSPHAPGEPPHKEETMGIDSVNLVVQMLAKL